MSLHAPINLARYAPPDFARLVPLDTAAELLKEHPDSLSKKCREKLSREGVAMLVRPPEGGQEKWFIYRSYLPALSHPDDPRFIHSDLGKYTKRQQDQAMLRALWVGKLRAARIHARGTMNELLDKLVEQARREEPTLPISRSQLYRWDGRYQYPADLWKLVDTRGGDRRHEASPQAWQAFRDLYLHENQPSIRQCWQQVEQLAAQNGWVWCKYQACYRNAGHHLSKAEAARVRTPVRYRQQLAPFIPQHPESWRAGELYVGDHKQLDVICRFGKDLIRPWLTAWMDWRTRKIVGYVLSDNPNSTTILGALRHALKDPSNMGGPSKIQIDNGRDFDAWLFHGQTKKQRQAKIKPAVDEARTRGIFNLLSIEPHFALAYNPNGKARLERWFRTLESFCKTFETYTGDGIETKPERLAEILKSPRLIPTFETITQRLPDHIAGYNVRTDHSIDDLSDGGLTISPCEAYGRWCDTKRVMADPSALDLLLQHWHKPVTAGRNGITLTLNGKPLHYGQCEPALSPFKALKKADRPPLLVSYDPADLQTVRVFTAQYIYVCTVSMNGVGGLEGRINKDHLKTMMRNKARYERDAKHTAEYAITSTLTFEEQLADAVARDQAAPAEPPSLRIVQTPLDGQASELLPVEFKQAAGGETATAPTRGAASALDLLRQNMRPREQEDSPSIDWRARLRERNHEW